jgi:putative ABC transport system permease protein
MGRGLWRRLHEVLNPRRLDRESVDELTHHLEMVVAQKIAAGLDDGEARRQARLEVGSVASAREQVAEERTGFALDQRVREVRYAARVLRRSPGLTLLSIVTMAVGIGVSGLLFALVNAVLLQPLPYPEPDRLVRIFDVNREAGIARRGAASGNIAEWRQRASAFEGITGYYSTGRTVSVGDGAEALITAQVSADFFTVLRAVPLLGRAFTPEESARATFNSAAAPIGADPVVILSHGFWLRRFGGDANALGQTVMLERRPFRVVGVMPPGFAVPEPEVELWIPWHISTESPRDQHFLGAIGRLRDGIPLGQAEEHLNAVAQDLSARYPGTNGGWRVELSPLAVETVGGAAAVLWVLLAAVGLVLLVACANVALLTLMRGLDRQDEVAVRIALGASSGRLIREFLIESALLSLVGGALGAAIAIAGVRWLPTIATDLPRIDEVAFDLRSVAFIAAVTIMSAVLSGLPQAWRRTRVTAIAGLTTATRGTTRGRDSHRLRDAIVIGQVALAVILMAGSGLLVRSFQELRATAPGFDPRGVLVVPIFLDNLQYAGERTRTYYRTLFERLAAIPGVVSVGGGTTVPTSPLGPGGERPVWRSDRGSDGAANVQATVRVITPGYLQTLGLQLVAGRAIDDRDTPQGPRVIMISRTLASTLWPGESAVGKQLVIDYSTGTYPYEIVGVIGDLRFRGPRSEPGREFYLPHAQRTYLILNVVVKTAGDPRQLIPAVREAMNGVDPQVPAQGMYALEDLLGATYGRDRQAMITLLVFAAAAIALAVLSIYGVLSQRVRERSREIAVRMALGADTSTVIGWVARSGLRLIIAGLAAGLGIAWAASGALEAMLFGVTPTDPLTVIAVLAGVAAIGVIATLAPTWRATRINPVDILRR